MWVFQLGLKGARWLDGLLVWAITHQEVEFDMCQDRCGKGEMVRSRLTSIVMGETENYSKQTISYYYKVRFTQITQHR